MLAGTTSKIYPVFIQDSSSTTGAGLTGLVFDSAGLTAYYIREGTATATQISLVTATVGTWTSSGFKEIDATNMPGCYELHIPNAALAAGAKSVLIFLKGATNMAPRPIRIELAAVDDQNATSFGLSRLDATVSAAESAANTAATNASTAATNAGNAATSAASADTRATNIQGRIPSALVSGRMDASVGAVANDAITAAGLASDAANEIADALLDRTDGVESGITPRQAARAASAALAGKVSGAGSGSEVFKGIGTSTTRITSTVDDDGNRSAVTLNL